MNFSSPKRAKKIYTVTFSPAIDYYVWCDNFTRGETNRAKREFIHVGGKGINVSAMLKNLGISSVAFGCIAGFTGEAINSMIKNYGVATDFVKVDGTSRINLKMNSDGVESELNGQGPLISASAVEKIVGKLLRVEDGSTVVFAGALPKCMPADTYRAVLEKIKDKQLKIVLDTSGEGLTSALKYKPFLIKPNRSELEEIFSVRLDDISSVFLYANKLKEMGAYNVIVSLGADGACMVTDSGAEYFVPAPQGHLISSVGAGDSLVGGFLAGLEFYGGDYLSAFLLGVAAGSATAFTEWIAKADKIKELYSSITDKVVVRKGADIGG